MTVKQVWTAAELRSALSVPFDRLVRLDHQARMIRMAATELQRHGLREASAVHDAAAELLETVKQFQRDTDQLWEVFGWCDAPRPTLRCVDTHHGKKGETK